MDAARRIVFTDAHGHVSQEESLVANRRLRANPEFDPTFDQLLDARSVVRAPMDVDEMARVVAASPFGQSSRRAIVVSSNTVYGFARMYKSLAEGDGGDVQVFWSIEEAHEWLGLE